MKQMYLIEIEGDKLPLDMSRDIACQLDCSFLNEGKVWRIHVEKGKYVICNNKINKIRRKNEA